MNEMMQLTSKKELMLSPEISRICKQEAEVCNKFGVIELVVARI